MKPKAIVTIALLLFVVVSIVYLVVKETGGKVARSPGTTLPVSGDEAQDSILPPDEVEGTRVVAYYFHGNVRCTTCRTIESYAKEAIQTEFVDALRDGRLEWRVVDVEDSSNEHFVQDFQLSTRSVVLERVENGKRQEWKSLHRVWELVHGDKEIFLIYIQDETRDFLEAVYK